MAIMYPKNIELYDATLSEKKVYRALQTQLPDSYTVFYSVKWVVEEDGKNKESECDFLIFHENEGFLTCEVKGGKGYKKTGDKFVLIESDGERELTRSPMEQAEENSRYFFNLYSEEYNDSFNGLYGSFSLFPFYRVNDPVLLDHRSKEIVLDIDDMNNLEKKVKKIFNFYKTKRYYYGSLTKTQRANFKNMINKKIAVQAAAGAIIEAKEFELNSVNRIQDNLIYFLKNYNRTFITGGAGTGKTWIAIKFAKMAYKEGRKTLLVTQNKPLTHLFARELANYPNIIVHSFSELLEDDGIMECMVSEQLLNEYDGKYYSKYDAIIVDEAQDFDQYQALIISMHLQDESSELRVFYDLTQNIHDKDFKDGFDISLPPFLLRENLRNTSSIYDWATEKTNLGKEVITNQIIGPAPVSYTFTKSYDLLKQLETTVCKLVDKENVPISSITVIMDPELYEIVAKGKIARWDISDKDMPETIRVSLVEDFKGLESNIVFYLHDFYAPEKYNYVAYTRAKYYLFEYILKG